MSLRPTRIAQNIARTAMLLEIFVGHSPREDGFAVVGIRFDGGEGADGGEGGLGGGGGEGAAGAGREARGAEEGAGGGRGGEHGLLLSICC
mmetsp:Transcript_12077/g.25733  ORF Transcript_12077/g.25733 Transcript_12077/m.25733 type:complete len:91 (-) Transcript_12077:230-502(-)